MGHNDMQFHLNEGTVAHFTVLHLSSLSSFQCDIFPLLNIAYKVFGYFHVM